MHPKPNNARTLLSRWMAADGIGSFLARRMTARTSSAISRSFTSESLAKVAQRESLQASVSTFALSNA